MSALFKFGFLGLLAGGGYLLFRAGSETVSEWADQVNVKFHSIGKPSASSGKIAVPVNLVVTNPTPLSVPIDNLKIRLIRNNAAFAETDNTGAFQIQSGETPITLRPVVDLNKLMPEKGNLIATLTTVLSSSSPVIQFIAEITVRIAGFDLVITEPQQFYLNDFINAR